MRENVARSGEGGKAHTKVAKDAKTIGLEKQPPTTVAGCQQVFFFAPLVAFV